MLTRTDDHRRFVWTITSSWTCFILADICGVGTFFIDTTTSISYYAFVLLALMFIMLSLGTFFAHLRFKQLRIGYFEQEYLDYCYSEKKQGHNIK